MTQDIDTLTKRIDRLEAKEAVLSAFNRYLYSLDTGFGDEIIDCYTEDAVLDVPNFPGAGGDDLHFEGKTAIAPLYAPYGEREPRINGGHHSANIAINVSADSQRAEVSAYFMTSMEKGVQGGRYEGVMVKCEDAVWRWQTVAITSAWGWSVDTAQTTTEAVDLRYSPFGGRHVAYTP